VEENKMLRSPGEVDDPEAVALSLSPKLPQPLPQMLCVRLRQPRAQLSQEAYAPQSL